MLVWAGKSACSGVRLLLLLLLLLHWLFWQGHCPGLLLLVFLRGHRPGLLLLLWAHECPGRDRGQQLDHPFPTAGCNTILIRAGHCTGLWLGIIRGGAASTYLQVKRETRVGWLGTLLLLWLLWLLWLLLAHSCTSWCTWLLLHLHRRLPCIHNLLLCSRMLLLRLCRLLLLSFALVVSHR
jgi:hypothetical protein